MRHVEIDDAQMQLDVLIDALNAGTDTQIVLTRDGRPAALLVPPLDDKPMRR